VKKSLFGLPRTVVVLGAIGLLINISTTMIYSQLSMYLKHVLGVDALQAATLDGVVEAISHITRIASGVLSDVFQHRKAILILGYALTTLAKPLYLLSSSILFVFCAQSLDRLGNGTIASPRDALVGDVTNKPQRGASYGFLKSLKTAGSVIGAFVGMWIMAVTLDDFDSVFFWAVVPAIISFILLLVFVKEPKTHHLTKEKKRFRLTRDNLKLLGRPFWMLILLASFFELAHFSETLLSWRANESGVAKGDIAMVMVTMNMGQFLVAYPLGRLSDRFSRYHFLVLGFFFMVLANFFMGYGQQVWVVMTGIFFWGAQMSTTQSIFLSMISTEVDPELRGTAFGIFYFMTGICYFFASELAGFLWKYQGFHFTFGASGIIALVSMAWGFFMFKSRHLKKTGA